MQLPWKENGVDNCQCTLKELVSLIKNFPVRFQNVTSASDIMDQ